MLKNYVLFCINQHFQKTLPFIEFEIILEIHFENSKPNDDPLQNQFQDFVHFPGEILYISKYLIIFMIT
jgi:hypothetical protein